MLYKNIVVPVDLSDKNAFRNVIQPALNLVNAFGSKLHLIHIIPDFGMKVVEDYLPKNWLKEKRERYGKVIDKLIKDHIPEDVEVTYSIERGAIYDKVITYAENNEADLIIISAVRPQLRDYMLGPNASKIVRHSSVSVLVVRE